MTDAERERAQHHRSAMESRRTIEMTFFAATVTAQLALVALAASQVGKPSDHVVARFSGLTGIVLTLTYVALVLAAEVNNSRDRAKYREYEVKSGDRRDSWVQTLRRSWAGWPVISSLAIGVLLVWTTIDLGW